jgi:outer membrane protein TolC
MKKRQNTKRNFLVLTTVLILAISMPVLAEEAQETLTLQQIVGMAIKNNPSIIESQKRWEEKQARVPLASAQPNPQFGIMKDDIPNDTLNIFDGMMTELSLTQEIMNPAKLKAMKKMARSEAEMFSADYRDKQMEIYASAKQSYYDLLYTDKALEIGKENQELMEQLVQIAEVSYSTGRAPMQDVLLAQTELSSMASDLLSMSSMVNVARAKLNNVMGRPSDTPFSVKEEFLAPPPDFDLAALHKDAIADKPAVVSMARQVDMASDGVTLAKKQRLPDFEFSIGYNIYKGSAGTVQSSIEPDPDPMDPMNPMATTRSESMASQSGTSMGGQPDTWKVGLMIMLPLWGSVNKAEVAAAEAGVEVARASLEDMKNMTDLDLLMALTEAESAWRQIDLYENTVIPLAEQTYRSGVASYTSGQVDFSAVLGSLNTLQNAKLDHYKARVNYEKAVTDLEKAAGKPLIDNMAWPW